MNGDLVTLTGPECIGPCMTSAHAETCQALAKPRGVGKGGAVETLSSTQSVRRTFPDGVIVQYPCLPLAMEFNKAELRV